MQINSDEIYLRKIFLQLYYIIEVKLCTMYYIYEGAQYSNYSSVSKLVSVRQREPVSVVCTLITPPPPTQPFSLLAEPLENYVNRTQTFSMDVPNNEGNGEQRDPIINARDRLFHTLFFRLSLAYARYIGVKRCYFYVGTSVCWLRWARNKHSWPLSRGNSEGMFFNQK